MKASISGAVTSSGASTGCKAVVRTAAGRLRQDWRVAADEPKQKGLDDGKPGALASRAGTATGGRSSTSRAATERGLREHETPPAFEREIFSKLFVFVAFVSKKTKRENPLCSQAQAYRAPNYLPSGGRRRRCRGGGELPVANTRLTTRSKMAAHTPNHALVRRLGRVCCPCLCLIGTTTTSYP